MSRSGRSAFEAIEDGTSRRQRLFGREEVLGSGHAPTAIIATADDVCIGSDRFGAGLHRNPKFIGAVHHKNTMPHGSEARPVPWRLLAAILTATAGASSAAEK